MPNLSTIPAIAGIVLSCAMLLSLSDPAHAYGRGNNGGQQRGLSTRVAALPLQDLSTEEEVGLVKMREEEKLARDVYQVLYQQWGHQVFANISRSEQRHMDAVKALLDKYNLVDPVTDSQVGVFTDPEMQTLYESLVAEGRSSLVAAFHVGATIEDLDIKDLYELLEKTDNDDIKMVYENLSRGSRNHLRAFTTQLLLSGQSYEAQFLTQEQIDDIITSPMERGGNGGGRGAGRQRRASSAMNGSRYLLGK